MASNSFKVKKSLNIEPTTSAGTAAGDVRVDSAASNKLKYHNGTSEEQLITADQLADLEYDNATSGLTADNPQDAIDEVVANTENAQDDIDDHLADTTGAHAASAIAVTPTGNLAADDVQEALVELQTDIDSISTAASDAQDDIDNHIADATDAHDASAISVTPTGNLAADDVQEALVELQTDVDTRITASSTDTLTNKTLTNPIINGANQTFGTATDTNRLVLPTETTTNLNGLTDSAGLIAFDSTQGKPVYNDGTTWKTVGSGSGGDTNYISNPDAEGGTTGWSTYADAAAATPVDGTGGSPNSTWTQSSSSPLTGTFSFLWSKSANDRQGEGVSYDFTIDSAQQAKVLQVEFDYAVASGTFVAGSNGVDSDLVVYIYDVTNGVLIQPSTYKLFSNATSPSARFVSNFQTSSNATSYRLIIHTATTSASAYTVKFDNVKVTPSKYVYGTPITDWTAYTPTLTGFGTPSAVSFRSRRVGDSVEIQGVFTSGTSTGVEARISLPSGLTTSSTLPTGTSVIGPWTRGSNTGVFAGYMLAEQSVTYLTFGSQRSDASGLTKQLGNSITINGTLVSFIASVQIAGWFSSVQMSDSADQRVLGLNVSASSDGSMGTITSSNSDVTWNTKNTDTHAAFGTTTYTVLVSGLYDIFAQVNIGGSSAGNRWASIVVNGVSILETQLYVGTNGNMPVSVFQKSRALNAGDTVKIQSRTDTTSPSFRAANSFFSLNRQSGPSAIGATETVAAKYAVGTGASTASSNPINYDTKIFDTHGAVTTGAGTWAFTSPARRLYIVSSSNYASGAAAGYFVYVNGTLTSHMGNSITGNNAPAAGSTSLYLNAGDTVQIRPNGTVTPTAAASGTIQSINYISITSVGI